MAPTVQTLPMSDLHPDDEALSAHLDGAAPADEGHEVRDHVEGCATCTARLEQLRRVRAAVGAPVAPPPDRQRDAAVARALDAAGRQGGARSVGAWAAGIAAATLLVLGAAFGLAQLSDRDGDQLATTGAKLSTPAAESGRTGSAAAPATGAGVAELGDLGALSDSAALRGVVQPRLARLTVEATKGAGATSEAPQQFAAGDAARVAPRQCVDAAQALDPANVRPAATGTATWQGTPAEVLVYAVAGRPGAARVYVVAQADCRVLEFQSYAP